MVIWMRPDCATQCQGRAQMHPGGLRVCLGVHTGQDALDKMGETEALAKTVLGIQMLKTLAPAILFTYL